VIEFGVEREAFGVAVDDLRHELAEVERDGELMRDDQRRYRRAGDRALADQAMLELARIDADAAELRERIATAEARLAEWTAEPDIDAALDFYNRLVEHVRGRIADADTAAELNAALSGVLAGAWMASMSATSSTSRSTCAPARNRWSAAFWNGPATTTSRRT
jgi:hypothetical protein